MIKVESARGRQITLAQLVVACRQRIRGQRQLVPRRTGKLAEWIRLVCPVESRRAWSVMVDAVLAALVIVGQTLAQFGHPVSCPANSLDSSRRSLANTQPSCCVARPHRNTGYGVGLAPCLTADFIRFFIFGIYGTGH